MRQNTIVPPRVDAGIAAERREPHKLSTPIDTGRISSSLYMTSKLYDGIQGTSDIVEA